MNIIDIVLLIVAVWALYAGARDGLLVQIGGVVGLVVGIWLAFRQAARVGAWFGMHGAEASVAGFISVLVVTVIVIAVGSRLVRGVFRMTGLGFFDAVLGAGVSVLKAAVVASLIIAAIDAVNVNNILISKERIESSRAYVPLRN
ncbi:MAG: CvpA family protein, partial [Rikenellaceae bacterium]|nr:CvpA family protein [Rikenellaceae bacterium]